MKRILSTLVLFLTCTTADASTLYNVQIKYETAGGTGFTAAYIVISGSQLLYSNINIANKNSFASIKLPLHGGSGCRKNVIQKNVVDGVESKVIQSLCVQITRESDNTFYVRESRTAKLSETASTSDYSAYHFYIGDNSCTVNVDAAWRTYKNTGPQEFQATKLITKVCLVPGPGFFGEPVK